MQSKVLRILRSLAAVVAGALLGGYVVERVRATREAAGSPSRRDRLPE